MENFSNINENNSKILNNKEIDVNTKHLSIINPSIIPLNNENSKKK